MEDITNKILDESAAESASTVSQLTVNHYPIELQVHVFKQTILNTVQTYLRNNSAILIEDFMQQISDDVHRISNNELIELQKQYNDL